MAINLTIPITDAEQAKLLEVAALVNPDATAAQVKTWAIKFCKEALRAEALRISGDDRREKENAARRDVEEAMDVTWVPLPAEDSQL